MVSAGLQPWPGHSGKHVIQIIVGKETCLLAKTTYVLTQGEVWLKIQGKENGEEEEPIHCGPRFTKSCFLRKLVVGSSFSRESSQNCCVFILFY